MARKLGKRAHPASNQGSEEVIYIPTTQGSALERVAAALEVTTSVLIHEFIAIGFRDLGVSLPIELVEYLERNGRPIPPGAKLDPKRHEIN